MQAQASLGDFPASINGIVNRIAFQLGDYEPASEFETFDKAWVTARVQDTFKWLQGRRPALFADTRVISLQPGHRQPVPEDCERLLEVDSVLIEGKEYPALTSDYELLESMRVYDKLMPTCGPQCVYHVALSTIDERLFWVTPPVSPVASGQARVSCSDLGRYFTDPDKVLECDAAKWINTVVEYVLYQAYAIDSDNPVSSALAESHRVTFFDLAPVQRRENSDR